MRQIDISGNGIDRFLLGVDHNIDDIGETGCPGRIQHIVMDRVAVYDAGTRLRACDELPVMVVENRLSRRDSGKDALSSAGKAGKEMGLDKALRDQQVSLGRKAVDDEVSAGGKFAEIDLILCIVAVMDHDLFIFHDLGAEL